MNEIWFTRDGREIPVHELKQTHLENLIVWCDKQLSKDRSKKSADFYGQWAKIFNEEHNRRKCQVSPSK